MTGKMNFATNVMLVINLKTGSIKMCKEMSVLSQTKMREIPHNTS